MELIKDKNDVRQGDRIMDGNCLIWEMGPKDNPQDFFANLLLDELRYLTRNGEVLPVMTASAILTSLRMADGMQEGFWKHIDCHHLEWDVDHASFGFETRVGILRRAWFGYVSSLQAFAAEVPA